MSKKMNILVFLNTNLIIYFSIRVTRSKAIGFWEDVCSTMIDKDFRRYFCMNATTLRTLCQFLKAKKCLYQGGREERAPAKAIAMTLAFLGSQLPYKQMSGFSGVSEAAFIHTMEYIMQILQQKSSSVIKWPEKKTIRTLQQSLTVKGFDASPMLLAALMGVTSELLQKKNE